MDYEVIRDKVVISNEIFLYEDLLSAREEEIKHRMDEVELLKILVSNFIKFGNPMKKMDGFFYSFTIPQISVVAYAVAESIISWNSIE